MYPADMVNKPFVKLNKILLEQHINCAISKHGD